MGTDFQANRLRRFKAKYEKFVLLQGVSFEENMNPSVLRDMKAIH